MGCASSTTGDVSTRKRRAVVPLQRDNRASLAAALREDVVSFNGSIAPTTAPSGGTAREGPHLLESDAEVRFMRSVMNSSMACGGPSSQRGGASDVASVQSNPLSVVVATPYDAPREFLTVGRERGELMADNDHAFDDVFELDPRASGAGGDARRVSVTRRQSWSRAAGLNRRSVSVRNMHLGSDVAMATAGDMSTARDRLSSELITSIDVDPNSPSPRLGSFSSVGSRRTASLLLRQQQQPLCGASPLAMTSTNLEEDEPSLAVALGAVL